MNTTEFYITALQYISRQYSSVFASVNEGRSAVACALSYVLFEPEDEVMKQNLLYYKAYSDQWELQADHFTPRTVRGKVYESLIPLLEEFSANLCSNRKLFNFTTRLKLKSRC